MSTPAITEMTTDDLEKTITDKISLSEPEEDIDVSDDDLDDDEVPDIIDDNDIIAIDEKNKNIEEEAKDVDKWNKWVEASEEEVAKIIKLLLDDKL